MDYRMFGMDYRMFRNGLQDVQDWQKFCFLAVWFLSSNLDPKVIRRHRENEEEIRKERKEREEQGSQEQAQIQKEATRVPPPSVLRQDEEAPDEAYASEDSTKGGSRGATSTGSSKKSKSRAMGARAPKYRVGDGGVMDGPDGAMVLDEEGKPLHGT